MAPFTFSRPEAFLCSWTYWLVSPVSYSCVNLHNQQHVLVMCAVAFYMMENYPLDVGAEFMAGIIQVIASAARPTVKLNWH